MADCYDRISNSYRFDMPGSMGSFQIKTMCYIIAIAIGRLENAFSSFYSLLRRQNWCEKGFVIYQEVCIKFLSVFFHITRIQYIREIENVMKWFLTRKGLQRKSCVANNNKLAVSDNTLCPIGGHDKRSASELFD